jgi:quercetin dioxygenase-like cupin family protein
MNDYLTAFDAARHSASNAADLRQAMMQKYGTLAVPVLLAYGAQSAFRPSAATPALAPAPPALRVHDVDSFSWIPSAAPGLELAIVDGSLQGDGEYVVALRYKAGTKTPPHSHPEEMRLVVVRGQFFVGAGPGAGALNPGSVVVIPKGSAHAEGAVTDAVVLIYGKAPMRIDVAGGPPGSH